MILGLSWEISSSMLSQATDVKSDKATNVGLQSIHAARQHEFSDPPSYMIPPYPSYAFSVLAPKLSSLHFA